MVLKVAAICTSAYLYTAVRRVERSPTRKKRSAVPSPVNSRHDVYCAQAPRSGSSADLTAVNVLHQSPEGVRLSWPLSSPEGTARYYGVPAKLPLGHVRYHTTFLIFKFDCPLNDGGASIKRHTFGTTSTRRFHCHRIRPMLFPLYE